MKIQAGSWAGFKNLYDYNYDGGFLKSNEYICYLQVGNNFIAMVVLCDVMYIVSSTGLGGYQVKKK